MNQSYRNPLITCRTVFINYEYFSLYFYFHIPYHVYESISFPLFLSKNPVLTLFINFSTILHYLSIKKNYVNYSNNRHCFFIYLNRLKNVEVIGI